jgi:peptide/nickel transport system substrate-binding protein
MRRSPEVAVVPNNPLGYILFCVINHPHPPFDRVEARRALMAAVKQSTSCRARWGMGRRGANAQPCSAAGRTSRRSSTRSDGRRTNPAKGAAMLRAAGYDGRPIVVLDPADNATLHPGTLLIAEALRKIGATVDLQAMD